MALDFVFSVASKFVGYFGAPICSELGYIISYTNNVNQLRTKLQTLKAAKVTLQRRVDTAEQNGEEIFDHVQDWLVNVDGIVSTANDFQNNEEHASFGCSGGSFTNLWTRYQQSKKATEMVNKISEVLITLGNYVDISYLPRLRVAYPPFARGYGALPTRTLIVNKIMSGLKDDNVYMIGVWGLGGVGKTTLIEEVAWQAEHGSFDTVVVATVTHTPDVVNIQDRLAEVLGLKFDVTSIEGRAKRLWDKIIKVTKILVIMDDIWKRINLTEVGVPFGDDHKGCKLLLTSRNLNVLKSDMGTQKNFKLETLCKEEYLNLFEKKAGDVVKDIRIQHTAFEVARACRGLPLLIVTVAKALKNQDLHAWKDALSQLIKYDHEGLASVANECVELSYKYLESDQHKSLFLLIGSSGRKSVYIEDLVIRGWGLGLFKDVESLTNARNRLYKLIDDLKASSLLEGEREWFRMHDVIREGACKIASKVQPVFLREYDELKEWPKMDLLKNCKHIFLSWCYLPVLPDCLECPELEILVICSKDNYLKVPDHFFSGMRNLKVLELGGMMCTPSLPPSLRLLKNLEALHLQQCILEDITVVCELTGLEILCVENSEIQELPKEIGQLTHLRLLSLCNCSGLRVTPANLISSLTSFEEVYMGNRYNERVKSWNSNFVERS